MVHDFDKCGRPHMVKDHRSNRDPRQPEWEKRVRCAKCGWQGPWTAEG